MKRNLKQTLLTGAVTICMLIPVIIKIVQAFDIKLATMDLLEMIAEFVFIILSYGIGAIIAGIVFSKIHVKKYIAFVGSAVIVAVCALVLPSIFMAVLNRLFDTMGIIGIAIAFIIAILCTYLSGAGVFVLISLIFNRNLDSSEKIIGTLWIQRIFKDKKGA